MKHEDVNENKTKAIFRSLPEVAPSPYLAGRVAAIAMERRRARRQVRVWQAIGLTAVLSLLVVLAIPRMSTPKEALYTYQPYVIHVNLEENEVKLAASAEVELPEGVTFVSKDEDVQSLRSLKLPIASEGAGRRRLPFVVKSDRSGTLPLQVRIYDEQNHLIQTKQLILNFVRAS